MNRRRYRLIELLIGVLIPIVGVGGRYAVLGVLFLLTSITTRPWSSAAYLFGLGLSGVIGLLALVALGLVILWGPERINEHRGLRITVMWLLALGLVSACVGFVAIRYFDVDWMLIAPTILAVRYLRLLLKCGSRTGKTDAVLNSSG